MTSTTSYTAKKPTHVFEVSGIGFAPFGVVSPSHDFQQACPVFWCEHCGRTLKHRHFVKDVNGKIAVVGSQCILKSGDAGLVDEFKLTQKRIRAEQRQAIHDKAITEALEEERQRFSGMTRAEIEAVVKERREELARAFFSVASQSEVLEIMQGLISEGNSFSFNMVMLMRDLAKMSERQWQVIAEIVARFKSNGSRKNSKAYKAQLPAATALVDDLKARHAEYRGWLAEINNKTMVEHAAAYMAEEGEVKPIHALA